MVAVMFCLCFIVLFVSKKSHLGFTNDDYTLHYSTGTNDYKIETKKIVISVTKYDVVNCFVAPCNPIKDDHFVVFYTKKYRSFIENLFQNEKSNVRDITDADLNDEQKEILYRIIKKSKTT